jgi:hypothetical protein
MANVLVTGMSDRFDASILGHVEPAEPLLRASCTHEIDASRLLAEVLDDLIRIGREPGPS